MNPTPLCTAIVRCTATTLHIMQSVGVSEDERKRPAVANIRTPELGCIILRVCVCGDVMS